MNTFNTIGEFLKHINDNGEYIWKPSHGFNPKNHLLLVKLKELVNDKLIKEEDISSYFWLFKFKKIRYTLTDKGKKSLDTLKPKKKRSKRSLAKMRNL